MFNDALLILGLDDIITIDDDSNRRYKLSQALSSGIVGDLMEDLSWQFGMKTIKMAFNPSYESEWGFTRIFDKPDDLHRIDGIYSDEYQNSPIKNYMDEDGKLFCDYDEIFFVYITKTFLTSPAEWPTFFRRLVAARMAKDAGPSLRNEGANFDNAKLVYEERKSSAFSNDAMSSPPRRIQTGNWIRSRHRGGYQGRP